MEMIQIDRASYDEFLSWKNGGTTPQSGKAPEGGWKHYRPGLNPWAKETFNSSAQMEIAARDIDLAISLVERLPNRNDYLPTLKEIKRREVLRAHGY